ncbi:RING-type E3 ubiquitin transferase [Salvia divinorum]|uniref:RING-type E3 ubiquitin transferase n=1 Tax=Salvia divinorum TaxID=28513 RepID=A0ABD1G5P6_SALDI
MSSEATSPHQSQPFPSEFSINSSDGGLPFFLPFILRVAALNHDHPGDLVVLINAITQTVVILEGGGGGSDASLDDLLPPKSGRRPATKASIDAMPSVEVASGGEQCAICLEGWEEGERAKEMPCKHRFHGGCIERWLNVSGSCPVCRFEMPEEEKNREESAVWVSFSFGGRFDGENGESNEYSESETED